MLFSFNLMIKCCSHLLYWNVFKVW